MGRRPLFVNTYLVRTKSDDYGACITELVATTQDKADEYYNNKLIEPVDVAALKKYFQLVDYEEERGRSDNERFYGNE